MKSTNKYVKLYEQALKEAVKRKKYEKFTKTPVVLSDHKAWITPDGQIINLKTEHWQHINDNKDLYAKKYGLVVKRKGDGVRMDALDVGFFRVNYMPRGGELIVEGKRRWLGRSIKEAIFDIVAKNRADLWSITVNLYNDNFKGGQSKSANLSMYDDNEKLEHIPLVTENVKDNA